MFKQLRFGSGRKAAEESALLGARLQRESEMRGRIAAIDRAQAVIEFALDGTILDANANFLKTMGYRLDEVQGRHHSMFVEPGFEHTEAYQQFWAKLRRGEFDRGEYKRIDRDGQEVWLVASYSPVFGRNREILKIVKLAMDVTEEKLRNAESSGQMAAIQRVQGVIEFDMDGTILTANEIFLDLMGYTLAEMKGRHHSMFMQAGEEESDGYLEFWRNLREGRPDACVYKRIGNHGRVVWIQASYSPILDLNGRPRKVVKFATDLTGLICETESTKRTAMSVAASSAAMSRSITEIHQSMESSREATARIAATSKASELQAVGLLESMESMAKIVTLIRSIAGQIDLLALNATIEATRAGEAGKGFAVVASEVTLLSGRTSRANEEIGEKISAVQAISAKVAESVQHSLEEIERVNECVSSVAHAIEKQGSVIHEISDHATQMVSAVESILSQTRGGNGQQVTAGGHFTPARAASRARRFAVAS